MKLKNNLSKFPQIKQRRDFMIEHNHGNLLIIGGAEDKKDECVILKHFFQEAGGRDPGYVLLPLLLIC
jgi:cyanophycinase-like exopeptidase